MKSISRAWVAALLLAGFAAATASYGAFFIEDWKVLDTGFTAVNAGWDPVSATLPSPSGSVFVGGALTATPTVQIYNAATGALTAGVLDQTGLTFGSLGYFAQTANAAGKIFAYSNSTSGGGELKVWDTIGSPASEVVWGGGFSRNLFAVGDRLYSVGAANGGPITISEPDGVTGDYLALYTFGDGAAGQPGGKAGVTATVDGMYVWGSEAISGGGFDGIHQWNYNAGSDVYEFAGNIVLDTIWTPVSGGGELRAMDVAVDPSLSMLFAIERETDLIFAINLGDMATIGDETVHSTYTIGQDVTYYGSLDIDTENKALYWMGRGTAGGDANLGKLTYIPEPATMALLGLAGLALLRRRR